MPLQALIEYFNQRFTEEYGLREPPLIPNGRQVEGRFRGLRFGTRLEPIRSAAAPSLVLGHDAAPRIVNAETGAVSGAAGLVPEDPEQLVNLDRLSRTVHMLNYLPLSHEDGTLFLPVHPRHVLFVKRDHGAYFEDIIQRCGLSTRRVVITLPVSPVYDRQMLLLLDRLKNYRDRGYATAVKFDPRAGEGFLERYCIQFLYRFTPDFVRFEVRFFPEAGRNAELDRRRGALLSAIRGLDTQLLIEGVDGEAEARLAEALRTDFVKGGYYDQRRSEAPVS